MQQRSEDTEQTMEEEEVQRPARILIDTLNGMPDDLLAKVSARSRTLKSLIKMPMVLIVMTSAL